MRAASRRLQTFSLCPVWLRLSINRAMTVEMVLADREGWDRYEAAKWMTMRRWLEENPEDDFAQEVRAELTTAPERHVTYSREYFGWGCLR